MRDSLWINKDGLEVGFGRRDTKNLEAGSIEVKGQVRQVELEVYSDESVTTASVKNAVIPAGAVIVGATLQVSTAFAGGTSVKVGTISTDGVAIDDDAFITPTAGAVANLTAGAVLKGAGAAVGTTVTKPTNVTYELTGTFTAGRGTLLVEYIQPSAK